MASSSCSTNEMNGLKKGPWTLEEDHNLTQYIQKHGHSNWAALPKLAGLRRSGKSCKLRWTNYLRPDINRCKFSQEEENTILHLHSFLGNKWSAIAKHLPGRTDSDILPPSLNEKGKWDKHLGTEGVKNYWNTHLKKKLIQMGLDPITHQPTTDPFLNLPQLMAMLQVSPVLTSSDINEQSQA